LNSQVKSIAVDTSCLGRNPTGIGRYVLEILSRMVRISSQSDYDVRWFLYGRKPCRWFLDSSGSFDAVTWRYDHFPEHIGRLLSLGVSNPIWAWYDRPSVFWAPAHRLPLWLPAATRTVVTIHDMVWLQAPETLRYVSNFIEPWAMRISAHRANSVLAVSESTARALIGLWPELKNNVKIIPLGVTDFSKESNLDSVDSRLSRRGYFLFVGTFEPRKNIPRLLAAYAKAAAGYPDFPMLAMAGQSGWGDSDILSLVVRLGIEGRVIILGYVPDSHLGVLYENAKAFLMPSIMEGFGLPLVEAMSYGIPVLTSDLSSMPEVVGCAGLLVDPYSEESIAQGLKTLFFDVARWNVMADCARSRSMMFSWDRAARETFDTLIGLAGNR
jgi:glycosyltransferase involved in cell wall biosynthesis